MARRFLDELIDRNLILVEKCNYLGRIKSCKIHDLLSILYLGACLNNLKEIPSRIGDISTLKSIHVEETCSDSSIELKVLKWSKKNLGMRWKMEKMRHEDMMAGLLRSWTQLLKVIQIFFPLIWARVYLYI